VAACGKFEIYVDGKVRAQSGIVKPGEPQRRGSEESLDHG